MADRPAGSRTVRMSMFTDPNISRYSLGFDDDTENISYNVAQQFYAAASHSQSEQESETYSHSDGTYSGQVSGPGWELEEGGSLSSLKLSPAQVTKSRNQKRGQQGQKQTLEPSFKHSQSHSTASADSDLLSYGNPANYFFNSTHEPYWDVTQVPPQTGSTNSQRSGEERASTHDLHLMQVKPVPFLFQSTDEFQSLGQNHTANPFSDDHGTAMHQKRFLDWDSEGTDEHSRPSPPPGYENSDFPSPPLAGCSHPSALTSSIPFLTSPRKAHSGFPLAQLEFDTILEESDDSFVRHSDDWDELNRSRDGGVVKLPSLIQPARQGSQPKGVAPVPSVRNFSSPTSCISYDQLCLYGAAATHAITGPPDSPAPGVNHAESRSGSVPFEHRLGQIKIDSPPAVSPLPHIQISSEPCVSSLTCTAPKLSEGCIGVDHGSTGELSSPLDGSFTLPSIHLYRNPSNPSVLTRKSYASALSYYQNYDQFEQQSTIPRVPEMSVGIPSETVGPEKTLKADFAKKDLLDEKPVGGFQGLSEPEWQTLVPRDNKITKASLKLGSESLPDVEAEGNWFNCHHSPALGLHTPTSQAPRDQNRNISSPRGSEPATEPKKNSTRTFETFPSISQPPPYAPVSVKPLVPSTPSQFQMRTGPEFPVASAFTPGVDILSTSGSMTAETQSSTQISNLSAFAVVGTPSCALREFCQGSREDETECTVEDSLPSTISSRYKSKHEPLVIPPMPTRVSSPNPPLAMKMRKPPPEPIVTSSNQLECADPASAGLASADFEFFQGAGRRVCSMSTLGSDRRQTRATTLTQASETDEKDEDFDLDYPLSQYISIGSAPLSVSGTGSTEQYHGSATSLPDLIRRATKLATKLESGKISSKNLPQGIPPTIQEPLKLIGSIQATDLTNENPLASSQLADPRAGSLSDLINSFPPPTGNNKSDACGTATTKALPKEADSNRSSIDPETPLPPLPAHTLKRKERRGCCGFWTNHKIKILVGLVCLGLVVMAVMVPVGKLVLNKKKNSQPTASVVKPSSGNNDGRSTTSLLKECQTKTACKNGGIVIVHSDQSCGCSCPSRFSGTTCEQPTRILGAGDTNNTAGDEDGRPTGSQPNLLGTFLEPICIAPPGAQSGASIGVQLLEPIKSAASNFGIPLDGPTIASIFADSKVSCAVQNAMVSFNHPQGLPGRRLRIRLHTRSLIDQPWRHQTDRTRRSVETREISQTPKALHPDTPVAIPPVNDILSFCKVAVLYLIQRTRTVSMGVKTQERLSAFLQDHTIRTKPAGDSAWDVDLGDGYRASLDKLAIYLPGGERIGNGWTPPHKGTSP